ncbi:MAG: response regulator [Acidobacteriota bacterium]|nr:response regulator [Acidobacteriota bacterium]
MRKKVLIAEDQNDIRRMMKVMLELHGYEAIEAIDGLDAVEKTYQFNPDLVLMDLAMPVLGGIDATKAIRHFDHNSNVPIVALTAYGDFYKQKAIDAGCTDVIGKPMVFESFKATIDSYLYPAAV